jgi:hypothetical protein
LALEVVSDLNSLLDKIIPIFVDDLRRIFIALLVDVFIIKLALKKVVHLDDWSEFDLDGRLLLSDLFKSIHDVTKRVDILSWFLNLEFNMLYFLSEVVYVGLGFLKEILSISVFPETNPFVETILDVIGLQAQGTNLVLCHNRTNFFLALFKIGELRLKIFKLRVFIIESSELFVDLLLPKPVVFLEAVQELVDIVLCSLDRTSQKEDDLDDFLILGDPVIEWLSLILRHIFLIPVLDMLSGFKDMGGSSVDSALNLFKSWLKGAGITLKMNINLEEWLQDLLWHVSSSANSLLHLVKRIFGGMEKSLIHGPVIVFG